LYGVTIKDGSLPQKIIFSTTYVLSKYMDSKPIHTTQEKIETTNEKNTYSLNVYVNYEIKSKLRSFGDDLQVIYPENFWNL
jgi:hypothetical protein